MREYGQVQCAFWQSSDASEMSDQGRLLALYLLTAPHSNGIGCYKLPDGYVMGDLCWSSETIEKGFTELFDKGFAYRFDGVVFLPKFLKWNSISNGNVAKARQAEFEALPKGEAKMRAARAMLEFGKHWSNQFEMVLETVSKPFTKGLPNQNPTQPNPDPDPNQPDKGSPDGDPPPEQKPLSLIADARAERLSQVTQEAVAGYNAILGKPNGKLSAVVLVNDVREKQVKRCLPTARVICNKQYSSATILPQFWLDYFGECANDTFKNGTGPYTGDHKNWRPDFDYLTREEVMTAVFDKAMSEHAA